MTTETQIREYASEDPTPGEWGTTSIPSDILIHMIWTMDDINLWRSLVYVNKATAKASVIQRKILALEPHKREYSASLMDLAAGKGYLDVVQWFHDRKETNCTTQAMDLAAGEGHLHIVQWLHANRTEGCTAAAMNVAAACGHVHIVQWLLENRKEGCTCLGADLATQRGHLGVLQLFHKHNPNGFIWSAILMDIAVEHGHMHIVQWLHQNRPEGCTFRAMDWAAKRGDVNMLQWLYDHCNRGASQDAMFFAMKNDHLPAVQWLNEKLGRKCEFYEFQEVVIECHGNYTRTIRWMSLNRSKVVRPYLHPLAREWV